nr:PREDICTED: lysine-rich coiled-coil protein 1 [Lepisosteus oculatus]
MPIKLVELNRAESGCAAPSSQQGAPCSAAAASQAVVSLQDRAVKMEPGITFIPQLAEALAQQSHSHSSSVAGAEAHKNTQNTNIAQSRVAPPDSPSGSPGTEPHRTAPHPCLGRPGRGEQRVPACHFCLPSFRCLTCGDTAGAPAVDLSELCTDTFCKVCGAVLQYESQRISHYEVVNIVQAAVHTHTVLYFLLACFLCLKSCFSHSAGGGTFVCPVCSVTLSSAEMYQAHMRGNKHQNQEPGAAAPGVRGCAPRSRPLRPGPGPQRRGPPWGPRCRPPLLGQSQFGPRGPEGPPWAPAFPSESWDPQFEERLNPLLPTPLAGDRGCPPHRARAQLRESSQELSSPGSEEESSGSSSRAESSRRRKRKRERRARGGSDPGEEEEETRHKRRKRQELAKQDRQRPEKSREEGEERPSQGPKEEKHRQKKWKHRKEKREKKEEVDSRTEEEKLWDESILGLM